MPAVLLALLLVPDCDEDVSMQAALRRGLQEAALAHVRSHCPACRSARAYPYCGLTKAREPSLCHVYVAGVPGTFVLRCSAHAWTYRCTYEVP